MKIGFLSLPLMGHLNPMIALARKLQSRGHEVVFIGVPDIGPIVRAGGLEFRPFCENEYPPGSVAKSWGGVANLHGLEVVRYTARELTPGLVRAALEHLPGKIAETGVNALILDTLYRLVELPSHPSASALCSDLECAPLRLFRVDTTRSFQLAAPNRPGSSRQECRGTADSPRD